MRTRVALCIAIAIIAGSVRANSQQILHVSKQVPVNRRLPPAILVPVRCDSSGNLYYQSHQDDSKLDSIQSLAPDGTLRSTFVLKPDSAEVEDLYTGSFFVAADGTVYELGWRGSDTYIFVFDKKGEYKSKVKVDANVSVYHIAAFDSGEFLVMGLNRGTPENPKQNTPLTGILDSNGKLVRMIRFQGDDQLQRAAESGDSKVSGSGGTRNTAVTLGMIAPGPDGNVYLMRRSSPLTIYAITPAGEVQNTITVDAGEPDMEPLSMQLYGRLLVAQFHNGARKSMYKVVSLPSGDTLATYLGGTGMGSALGCFDGTHLTFLVHRSGNLSVVQAEP